MNEKILLFTLKFIKYQFKTRQTFQPLAFNNFLVLKFRAQPVFKLFENARLHPGF